MEKSENEILKNAREKHGLVLSYDEAELLSLIRYAKLIGYAEGSDDSKPYREFVYKLKETLEGSPSQGKRPIDMVVVSLEEVCEVINAG